MGIVVMNKPAEEPVDAPSAEAEVPRPIIRADLCKACGLCIASCPKQVLRPGEYINELGYVATEYTGEGCIGCGTCYYVCPEPAAIAVARPPRGKERKGAR